MLHPLVEERRALRDVGIDPHANLEAARLEPLQHPHRIGEDARIPLEVAPVEGLHPEAVEVEDVQRQVAVGHPLDEAGDGVLVVVGGEGRGQPQAERPRGRQRGPSGERGVVIQHFFGRGPVDDEIVQVLARHAELHALDLLRGDLQRDLLRVVDEDAVAAIGQVKGDVLVRLLAAGAAVLLPQIDDLPVLDERREALAQAVDALADAERQLLVDEAPIGGIHHRPARASRFR